MGNIIQTAQNILLEPAEISDSQLLTMTGKLLGKQIDMADIYMQATTSESWYLEDSIVKEGSYNVSRGVGVRAIAGDKTGFAYSDEILLPALENTVSAARSIASTGSHGKVNAWNPVDVKRLYPAIDPLPSLDTPAKIALLHKIDTEARRIDKRVIQVNASLNATNETMLVYNSDGSLGADIRPLVRLNVTVIVEQEGRREQASSGGGGRGDYATFFSEEKAMEYTKEAVRLALFNLEATEAPAGTMPVVLGPGWPGVILHEAVGHGLEGDFNRKGVSAFSGRIGQRVASPDVTIVDDGTLQGRRGSLTIDDEGTPSHCTVLIEKGILKGYMHDKMSARLMGAKATGNGRRESYSHMTLPRMTNTYMHAGKHDPKDIIKSVDKGLYAVNFSGGQVDITSGKFVFTASEAYLIEKGKVTRPVKGATLIGNGPDALTRVSMVGNDLQLDHGVGVCGKEGQSVPVGVGQPTFKIDAITVGGTAG